MPTALEKAGARSVAELAEMPGVRDCLQWFTREKQWINEQHLRVVRIPAPTFFEQERAAYMAERFRELDCEVQLDGAGNVIALPRKASGDEYVVVSAHLDTVLAPRTPEEITVDSGGGLRGPGVSDNGAGLAGLLAVAAALHASPPLPELRRGLLLLANVCEEGEGNLNGMRHFCEDSALGAKARAFLVLDGPALDHITSTALESRRYEVSFSGPGGHSWSDFGTANPVHALGRALASFLEQQAGAAAGGGCSYNFGWIEGGTGVNSIPTFARAKVDLRSETGERMEAVYRLLTSAVERGAAAENEQATAGRVSARVRPIGVRPGGRLPEDAAILRCVRAVDAHLGIRAKLDCASTDANIPLSKGLQAVSIGAGGAGGGAHTPSEWYHSRGRDLGLKRVLLTLCLLLREAYLAGGPGE
ncbi:MAG: M20/M25/M40 family metallo-hydrolase [Bryobacteraceae bacterium]|nr:M20/M25/M40 family metallo-hydrolase [Bryobacteraceae bacterium]